MSKHVTKTKNWLQYTVYTLAAVSIALEVFDIVHSGQVSSHALPACEGYSNPEPGQGGLLVVGLIGSIPSLFGLALAYIEDNKHCMIISGIVSTICIGIGLFAYLSSGLNSIC
jgi:hypothetical protein